MVLTAIQAGFTFSPSNVDALPGDTVGMEYPESMWEIALLTRIGQSSISTQPTIRSSEPNMGIHVFHMRISGSTESASFLDSSR